MKTTDALARLQPTLTNSAHAELVRQIGGQKYLTEKEFTSIFARVVFTDTRNPQVRDVEFISRILVFTVNTGDCVYV